MNTQQRSTVVGVFEDRLHANQAIAELHQAGFTESQVRTWSGWHHHQALSLIAAWFLVQESRRGKKGDTGADGAAGARRVGVAATVGVPVRRAGACVP